MKGGSEVQLGTGGAENERERTLVRLCECVSVGATPVGFFWEVCEETGMGLPKGTKQLFQREYPGAFVTRQRHIESVRVSRDVCDGAPATMHAPSCLQQLDAAVELVIAILALSSKLSQPVIGCHTRIRTCLWGAPVQYPLGRGQHGALAPVTRLWKRHLVKRSFWDQKVGEPRARLPVPRDGHQLAVLACARLAPNSAPPKTSSNRPMTSKDGL